MSVPMSEQWCFVFVLVAMLGSALVAGVFFAFFSFVMKAVDRLPSAQGIAEMLALNITVLNLWFLGFFIGMAAVCFLLMLWSLFQLSQANAENILLGSMFCLVGSLVVTALFSVPVNERLAKVDVLNADTENIWCDCVSEWMF